MPESAVIIFGVITSIVCFVLTLAAVMPVSGVASPKTRFAFVLSILACVGVWSWYVGARCSSHEEELSSTPFSIIEASGSSGQVIQFVVDDLRLININAMFSVAVTKGTIANKIKHRLSSTWGIVFPPEVKWTISHLTVEEENKKEKK